MRPLQRWLAGLCCLVATQASASENAIFECAAATSQVCYFSILRQPGGSQSFMVQGHQRTTLPGLAPGRDWYLVSVGQPTPSSMDACKQAKFPCRVAVVHRGNNQ
jgi:hypothetical protein